MLRFLFQSTLVLVLLCSPTAATHAQVTVNLENGSSFNSSVLTESHDSIVTDSGAFAKRAVLFLTEKKADHVFNVVTGERTKVKLKEPCRACRAGRLYGAKYAGSGLDPEQFEPVLSPRMLADTLFIRFYRQELMNRDIVTDARGLLVRKAPSPPPLAAPPMRSVQGGRYLILFTNGDSVRVSYFRQRGDSIVHDAGRSAKREVLAIWNEKEVRTFQHTDGWMLHVPVDAVRSPCELGAVYAIKYWNADRDLSAIAITDERLRTDSLFVDCFRYQMARQKAFTDDQGRVRYAPDVPPRNWNKVVLRNGDTLSTKGDLHFKKGKVTWTGGGPIPQDSILFATPGGAFTVVRPDVGFVRPMYGVNDLSTGSLGLIYAFVYFEDRRMMEEIPAIPRSLISDKRFRAAYNEEKERLGAKYGYPQNRTAVNILRYILLAVP